MPGRFLLPLSITNLQSCSRNIRLTCQSGLCSNILCSASFPRSPGDSFPLRRLCRHPLEPDFPPLHSNLWTSRSNIRGLRRRRTRRARRQRQIHSNLHPSASNFRGFVRHRRPLRSNSRASRSNFRGFARHRSPFVPSPSRCKSNLKTPEPLHRDREGCKPTIGQPGVKPGIATQPRPTPVRATEISTAKYPNLAKGGARFFPRAAAKSDRINRMDRIPKSE